MTGARPTGAGGFEPPNAICTVTRFSLPYWKEIVDEHRRLGLRRVQLGPLEPIGRAKPAWGRLGTSAREFVDFYSRALDYLLGLNRAGHRIYEKGAVVFLTPILRRRRWRYPNVDALCRLAYDYNGGIYPSDEARLLANSGDGFFRMGHVRTTGYAGIMSHPFAKLSAATLSQRLGPLCARCVFSPYCRISPVHHYAAQGRLWGHLPTSERCALFRGIFALLFRRLEEPAQRRILESWLEFESE